MVQAANTEQLLLVLYDELRLLAATLLAKEKPGQTLQPTALVHEAYLRLQKDSSSNGCRWENQAHFFACAAQAMRRILVETARRKKRLKNGGLLQRVCLESVDLKTSVDQFSLLALDEVLSEFEKEYPRKSRVIKLRFFAGLSHDEVATALGLSTATAKRHWKFARNWLYRKLNC